MFWKRLLYFFIPSPGALTLFWVGLSLATILTLVMAVIAFSDPAMVASALALTGVGALPLGALLLAMATFVERKPGPRFWLWGLVLGLLVIASACLYYGLRREMSAPPTLALVCICLPVLLLPLGGLVFLGFQAYPAFRQALRAAQSQRIIEIIQARGEVQLANLCGELSLNLPQTQRLIRDLIAMGELMAYFDEENQIVYSAAALGEKQRRLLAMVNARGKALVEDLATELKIRRELVRKWTYALVERRQLHGFVDWAGGAIYSREIAAFLAENRCPHCGGQLDLAGKGLIQCEHCGVEVFR